MRAGLAILISFTAIISATLLPGNGIELAAAIPPKWCLACGGLWATDAVSNVLLFTPLGASLAWFALTRNWRLSVSIVFALCFGFLLSCTVEYLQSIGIPPARSAALADVVTNSLGALVGALCAIFGPRLVTARGKLALALGAVWLLLALLALALTSIAQGPRWAATSNTSTLNATNLGPSTLKHVPNNPWYEATNDSATVNGYHVKRGWGGPIIVAANAEGMNWNASVTVRGFDPLDPRIPLLFVHVAGDSSAMLMIAEHGRDAELVVTRKAWDWGLALPVLRLKNAFAGRTVNDPRPLTLNAQVTGKKLTLTAQTIEPDGSVTQNAASLTLTPFMGWAMLQTLVEVDSPYAPLVLSAWLLALFAPVLWWGWRGIRPTNLTHMKGEVGTHNR